MTLSPTHYADLQKSGLSDESITAAKIQTVPPRDIKKKLGFDFPDLDSMYALPYPGCDGFSRFRCFPAEGKKVVKYLQAKDSGNHLYIPPGVVSMLSDPAATLYVTEGEKKALKGYQEGLAVVAVGGLWNWKDKNGGLISDFDKLSLTDRAVNIIPDNDWLLPDKHGYKKNLEQAVYGLAYELIDRGATVHIVELPDGPAKGLDDYLVAHSAADFQALPTKKVRKLTIEEQVAETTIDTLDTVLKRIAKIPSQSKQEALVAELSKRLKISRTAIRKDLKRHGRPEGDNPDQAGNTLPFVEVEAWPTEVEPAQVLDDIATTIRRFIICTEEVSHAVSLWVAMTWLIDVVQVAPLAVITAPEKRCGKTLLLSIMGLLSARAITASNISPSALFRAIDTWSPTLLIDEADACMKDNEELRGLLNSGHTRDSAYVIRTVGELFTPTKFSTWGAKVLSGIGHVADTLMDRAVILELRRKLPHESVERIRHAEPNLFNELRSKLARFAGDYAEQVRQARPPLPSSLNDRAQDNWEPLLAIAMAAGGAWLQTGTTAALKLSGSESASQTIGVELLSDIQAIFDGRAVDRISTIDLISALCDDDEHPWKTYNRGVPITPRQIAKKLKDYGIRSKPIRIDDDVVKGYKKTYFTEAFSRYVPPYPNLSVTELQPAPVLAESGFCDELQDSFVTDKKSQKPAPVLNCNRVTDNYPLPEANKHISPGKQSFLTEVRV